MTKHIFKNQDTKEFIALTPAQANVMSDMMKGPIFAHTNEMTRTVVHRLRNVGVNIGTTETKPVDDIDKTLCIYHLISNVTFEGEAQCLG